MKIAIVGGGISGLACAYLLQQCHDVTLFEHEPRLGGHTHTVEVRHEGATVRVDTGFIVFNERNYPLFSRLLGRLGVPSQPSTMSFSVTDPATGFEYGGNSLPGLLAGGRNLLSPRFWSVARGVVRLGRAGSAMLRHAGEHETIEDVARRSGLSRGVLNDYLIPMAAAIWSASARTTREMPARFFLEFFDNHGMLDLRKRPRWRTVVGGSDRYVFAMRNSWSVDVRTASPVRRVTRRADGVVIDSASGAERFDEVILACHSDDALRLLAEPTSAERDVLGAMPYQANETILHHDESMLPRRRASWSAWNYRLGAGPDDPVAVTYDMTILQSLQTRTHLFVTLNAAESIDREKVLGRWIYRHPLYTLQGMKARARWAEVSGVSGIHYCGAYWGSGFHEDGVRSALRVCERFGVSL